MTEKEKKAINNLWSSSTDVMFNVLYSQEQLQEDLKIALNLIQKQEKENYSLKTEIEQKNKTIKEMCNNYCPKTVELKKSNKIIDKMALFIDEHITDCLLNLLNIDEACKEYAGENKKTCDVYIKQYFEKEIENE